MPDDDELAEAIIAALEDRYPNNEGIASLELNDVDVLRSAMEKVERRSDLLKDRIAHESKEKIHLLTLWRKQIKPIMNDIQRVKDLENEGIGLEDRLIRIKDASSDLQSSLITLEEQHSEHEEIAKALLDLKEAYVLSDAADNLFVSGEFVPAIQRLKECEVLINRLRIWFPETNIVNVLLETMGSTQVHALEQLEALWHEAVLLNHKLQIRKRVPFGSKHIPIETMSEALRLLNHLTAVTTPFSRQLREAIFDPIVSHQKSVSVKNDGLHIKESSSAHIFPELTKCLQYLSSNVPSDAVAAIANQTIPHLVSRLVSEALPDTLPEHISAFSEFETSMRHVREFQQTLTKGGWTEERDLLQWIDRSPKIWVARERKLVLDKVRTIMSRGAIPTTRVENVETVHNQDDLQVDSLPQQLGQAEDAEHNWGLDDDIVFDDEKGGGTEKDEDEFDAWGLDKTFEDETPAKAAENQEGEPAAPPSTVIREMFTVSQLPDEICRLIESVLDEIHQMEKIKDKKWILSSALKGMNQFIALIITAYRALSFVTYDQNAVSMMLLFNDCIHLSSELQTVDWSTDEQSQALQHYGKGVYTRILQTQQQILFDYLDDADGFVNCSQPALRVQCEKSIESMMAHLKMLADHWKPILSPSVHLQTLGTLVNTSLIMIIQDIEDIQDISVDDSEVLAQVVSTLAKLEELFIGEDGSGTAAVFCPDWLKFRYLGEILEGSLADVVYLYREQALIDFTDDELVGLIQALFADTDKRRKALEEIKYG